MADIAGRDALLAPSKRRFAEVLLPAKGVTVRIRSLMENEYSDLVSRVMLLAKSKDNEKKLPQARRIYIVACLVDADGNRIFNDQETALLRDWDAADISTLQDAINEHLKLSETDIETVLKNFGETTGGASP